PRAVAIPAEASLLRGSADVAGLARPGAQGCAALLNAPGRHADVTRRACPGLRRSARRLDFALRRHPARM
ncbi:MAG TPA: hypothetical protein VFL14_00525, partial [Xanthomonadales bacterium]|nr:hypothetical protein [Xanthomonadales bacterium]